MGKPYDRRGHCECCNTDGVWVREFSARMKCGAGMERRSFDLCEICATTLIGNTHLS